jgi:hypothetical protein
MRPVSIPVTTLAWVLLKDKNLTLIPGLGPEISSRSCLVVPPRLCHLILCWFTNQRLTFCCMTCLETPKVGSDPKNGRAEPCLASSSGISFPPNVFG